MSHHHRWGGMNRECKQALVCASITTAFEDHSAEPRKEIVRGAGDMTQQLGAFVLVEDMDLVLGTNMAAHNHL